MTAKVLYVDIEYHERLVSRFWSKVDKSGECWEWTSTTLPGGYGTFRVAPQSRPDLQQKAVAHRVAYQLEVGPIPNGLQLDHLCRNRSCVNPAHLEAVTQQENIRRGEVGRNMSDKKCCPKGHAYSSDNTRINASGARVCRLCQRDHARRYRREIAKST